VTSNKELETYKFSWKKGGKVLRRVELRRKYKEKISEIMEFQPALFILRNQTDLYAFGSVLHNAIPIQT